MDTATALRELVPNALWVTHDEEIVEWNSPDIPQPSKADIQAKIQELQAEYDANQYQRDRALAYPSWQDQLDTIYHQGIDTWKAQIKAIKDQHPKP